jgi:polar amino acid transport system substrate-binding protein
MNYNLPRVILVTAFTVFAATLTLAGEPAPGSGARVLRVGVTANSPPMVIKQGNDTAGLEADFARALGRQLGREIQFVEVPWEDLIDALDENKIDIIMSSMSITRARQFRIAFCDPYLRISQMALVRAADRYRFAPFSTSMANVAVGVKKATTGDLLVQQEFPKAKRKYYKSGDDAAKALKKGSIELFIDDSTMIWYLAGTYEADGLVVAPMTLSDELLAWGVRRSDAELLASVNEFLKKFKESGDMDKVMQRWIPKFQ